MYPNPQDALPLPPSPNVDRYRKLAKDLAKACRSEDPEAVRLWAIRWVESLAALQEDAGSLHDPREVADRADAVEQFARQVMTERSGAASRCAVTSAQFVIARAHGFVSWPKFVHHVESLVLEGSAVSAFERAVIAVVRGDESTLVRLLREQPALIHARSTREHGATLLHYVSANGVENYRQVSPKNSAAIARILLDAGADVDAEAHVYGGACTPLGLVSTSGPPAAAGVQLQVMDVLLDRGARMDRPGLAGNRHALVYACLANGQPQAAEHLAQRGAPLDLPGAAGLGRVDVLKGFVAPDGSVSLGVTEADVKDALAIASAYGRANSVMFLLEHGVAVDVELKGHGAGHTALHVASYHARIEAVSVVLHHGASVEAIDKTWGTKPLVWALTGWSRKVAPAERFYEVVAKLVAAGAPVTEDMLAWKDVKADPKMLTALTRR